MDVSQNLFDVTRRRHARDNKSLTFPDNAVATPRGTAYMEGAGDTAVLADGTKKFAGFSLVKTVTDISLTLPTVYELAGGERPLPIETPYFPGQEGAFEDADEYIAESSAYLTSSGGANDITAATTVGTNCSFLAGKTCKATSGQLSEYFLAEQLPPLVAGSNARCRFARREAHLVP